IRFPLRLSADLKAAKYGGYEQQHLKGKNIALIFEKTSTCTRTGFEVTAYDQGARIAITESAEEAVDGTDFVYTDVCVSMNEPDVVWKERIEQLALHRATTELMRRTGNQHTKFMHCLPAFHNTEAKIGAETHEEHGIDCMEVTEEVFESEASIALDQAENRMHTIKVDLVTTIWS
ncbi:MAG: hypothetical protein ACR2QH_15685, partial [Geminicoccaceae bacterium]